MAAGARSAITQGAEVNAEKSADAQQKTTRTPLEIRRMRRFVTERETALTG